MITEILSAPRRPEWVTPQMVDLVFTDNTGEMHPRYIQDAVGFTVECGPEGDSRSLIPYAVGWVESSKVIKPDIAKLRNVRFFVEHVHHALRVVQTTPMADEIERVYRGFCIPRSTYLSCQKAATNSEGLDIPNEIEKYRELEILVARKGHALLDASINQQMNNLKMLLANLGVYQTPELSNVPLMDAAYYKIENPETYIRQETRQVLSGWHSQDRIWIRSVESSEKAFP